MYAEQKRSVLVLQKKKVYDPALRIIQLFFLFFFLPSHFVPGIIYALPFSLLPAVVVTQTRGHNASRLSSSLLPTTYGSCLAFFIARRRRPLFLSSSALYSLSCRCARDTHQVPSTSTSMYALKHTACCPALQY